MRKVIFILFFLLLSCNRGSGHVLYTNRGNVTTQEQFRQRYEEWLTTTRLPDTLAMRKKFLYESLLDEALYAQGVHESVELVPDVKERLEEVKRTLIVRHMRKKMEKEFFAFSEDAEKKYYQEHPQEFVRKRLYRLFAVRSFDAHQASLIAEQLRKGGDIRLLSSRYSDDKVLAANGGDWGLFSADTMDEQWKELVLHGSLGDLFGPVKDSDGYWTVIQILGYAYKRKLSFNRARPLIIRKMMSKQEFQEWDKRVKTFLRNSGIRVDEHYLKWE